MRHLGKFTLAVALGAAAAQTAPAQVSTTTSSASTTTTTAGGTSSGLGGGGLGSGGGTPAGGGALGDSSLSSTPTIGAQTTLSTPTGIDPSNILGGYYSAVYWQGRPSTTPIAPGGFGQVLYGTSGGGTNGAGGFASASRTGATATTGRTGTTSALGGATGGGMTGATGRTQQGGTNTANQSGIVIALPRQIAYTATLQFKAPIATVPQIATDLRATLDRSTMVGNPRGVDVAMDGGVVVLKGNVASDDELRLVEGMMRLTPGVRDVRNELKVGPPTP